MTNDEIVITDPPAITFQWTFDDWHTVWRSSGKYPNCFHRFMMKLFFGWKFKKL